MLANIRRRMEPCQPAKCKGMESFTLAERYRRLSVCGNSSHHGFHDFRVGTGGIVGGQQAIQLLAAVLAAMRQTVRNGMNSRRRRGKMGAAGIPPEEIIVSGS